MVLFKERKKLLILFSIFFGLVSSCTENKVPLYQPPKEEIKSMSVFYDDVDIGTYKLKYQEKTFFGDNKLPIKYDFKTEEGYKRFFSALRNRDEIGITFSASFDVDTIAIYHNENLAYYSENITTNYSTVLAGGTTIKLYKNKSNYLGVKINKSKIYWCIIDPEYIGINIGFYNERISVSFSNRFVIYN